MPVVKLVMLPFFGFLMFSAAFGLHLRLESMDLLRHDIRQLSEAALSLRLQYASQPEHAQLPRGRLSCYPGRFLAPDQVAVIVQGKTLGMSIFSGIPVLCKGMHIAFTT